MPVNFSGTWKLDRNENMEEYLKALDVNAAKRKMIDSVKPTQIISHDGDKFVVQTKGVLKEETITYTLGDEFTRSLPPQNVEMKIVGKLEGDILVIHLTPVDKGKAVKVTRQIVDEELKTIFTVGDVEAVSYFKRA